MRQLIPYTEQQSVEFDSFWILSIWTCSCIWTLWTQSELWAYWRKWHQCHWPQQVNTQRSSDFPVLLMHSPSSSKVLSNGVLRHNRHEISKSTCIYRVTGGLCCCYVLVLGLAEVELIFFIAVYMVPCFGFVTKTVLISHPCFTYGQTVLIQLQDLLCFSLCPFSK